MPCDGPVPSLGTLNITEARKCYNVISCQIESWCGSTGYKAHIYARYGSAPSMLFTEIVKTIDLPDGPSTDTIQFEHTIVKDGTYYYAVAITCDGAIVDQTAPKSYLNEECEPIRIVEADYPPTLIPYEPVSEQVVLVKPIKTAAGFIFQDIRILSRTYQAMDWWYYRNGGCGSAVLTIRENFPEADLALKYGWEIHARVMLNGEETHSTWYRGVIRAVEKHQDGQSYLVNIRCQGYLEQLAHIMVQRRYPKNTRVDSIVNDIIDNFVKPNSRIVRPNDLDVTNDDSGVDESSYTTQGPIHFETNALKAIKFLAELQGDREFGVDCGRRIYFRTKKATFEDALFIEKDIVSVIDGGKGIDKTNQYKIGTKEWGHHENVKIVADVTDITQYGLFEKPIIVPWIEHDYDASRWANNQIAKKKQFSSWKTVAWNVIDRKIERNHPDSGLGMIRIYGKDVSNEFEDLDITKIHYVKGGFRKPIVKEVRTPTGEDKDQRTLRAEIYLGIHSHDLTEELEEKFFEPITTLKALHRQRREPFVDVTLPNPDEVQIYPGMLAAIPYGSDVTNDPYEMLFRDATNWSRLVKMRSGESLPASGSFVGEEFFRWDDETHTTGVKYYWDGSAWIEITAGSTVSSGAITWDKIGSGAVISGHIHTDFKDNLHTTILQSGRVTSGHIASGQIGAYHLQDEIIGSGKIQSGLTYRAPKVSDWIDFKGLSGDRPEPLSGEIRKYGTLDHGLPVLKDVAYSGTPLQEYRDEVFIGENWTYVAVGKGKAVYILSSGLSGDAPRLHLADNDDPAKVPCAGLTLDATQGSGGHIRVMRRGIMRGIVTNWFEVGDDLYLHSTAGDLTNTKPAYPSTIQKIAKCLVKDLSDGEIFVDVEPPSPLVSGCILPWMINSGAVRSGQVASGSIGPGHLANSSIVSGKLAANSVHSGAVSSGAIGWVHVGSGAIRSGHISSGSIGTNALGNSAVTSGNVGSGQIASGHMASGFIAAITAGTSVASGTITWDKISSGGLGSGSISSGCLDSVHIADGGLKSGVFGSGQIASGNIHLSYTDNIYQNVLQSGRVASGHIHTDFKDNIHTTVLQSGRVTSGHVASGQIGNNALANDSVRSGHVQSGSIAGDHISQGAIRSGHLVASIIISGLIASGAVGSTHLSDDSVRSGHVGSGQIASGHIDPAFIAGLGISVSSGSITWDKIGSGAVQSGHIHTDFKDNIHTTVLQSGRVTSGHVASGQIGPYHISSGSILSGTVASGSVVPLLLSGFITSGISIPNIISGSVTWDKIGSGAVQSGHIHTDFKDNIHTTVLQSGRVTSGHVASGQIGNNALANSSVRSGHVGSGQIASGHIHSSYTDNVYQNVLQSGRVTSGHVASGQIGDKHLANSSVRSGHVGSGQIASGHIHSSYTDNVYQNVLLSGRITSGHVASGQIGDKHLADNSVRSGHVISGSISQNKLSSGAVNSGHIASGNTLIGAEVSDILTFKAITPPSPPQSGFVRDYADEHKTFITREYIDHSGNVVQYSRDNLIIGKNETGSGILKGTPLTVAGAAGNVVSFGLAKADSDSTMPAIALAFDPIPDGGFGRAMTLGIMPMFTSGWAEGSTLFVSETEAGVLTTTPPPFPNFRQKVAVVIVEGLGTGSIQVHIGAKANLLSGEVTSGAVGDCGIHSGNICPGSIGNIHVASGGYTSGAIASGSIGSVHLSDDSVRSGDIGSGQIASGNIHPSYTDNVYQNVLLSGRVVSGHIHTDFKDNIHTTVLQSGRVTSGHVASGQIGDKHLSNSSVRSGHVGSGQIASGHIHSTYTDNVYQNVLLSGRVTSGHVASGQIGDKHLANSSVRSGHVGSGQVASGHIHSSYTDNVYQNVLQSGRVTSGHVASGQIGNNALANDSVRSGHLGSGQVASGHIDPAFIAGLGISVSSGSITWDKIGSGAVQSGHIHTDFKDNIHTTVLQSGRVTSGHVASGQIGTNHLGNSAVTSGNIGASQIASGHIHSSYTDNVYQNVLQSGRVTSGHVASGQIGNNALANSSVRSGHVGSGQVASGHIHSTYTDNVYQNVLQSGRVTSGHVASGQIGTNHLGNSSVTSGNISAGSVASGHIHSSYTDNVYQNVLQSGRVTSGYVASGQIGNNALSNDSVRSGHLGSGQVASGHIDPAFIAGLSPSVASGSITWDKLGSGAVRTSNINSQAVTSGKIGADSVNNDNMADDSVGTAELKSGCVNLFKLAPQAVRSGHLYDAAVNNINMAADSVGTTELKSGCVTLHKLAPQAVRSGHIYDAAVNNINMAADSVGATELKSGCVNLFKLAPQTIRSGHIYDTAVVYGNIAADAVGTNELRSGSVTQVILANNSVRSGHINDGSVVSGKIAQDNVVSGHIHTSFKDNLHTTILQSGRVASGHIHTDFKDNLHTTILQSGRVTSGHIASGQIGTNHLGNSSVTSGNIGTGEIASGHIHTSFKDNIYTTVLQSGRVTSGHIASGQLGWAHISSGSIYGYGHTVPRHISSGTISVYDIGSGAIQSGHIASGQIGSYHLADGAIGTSDIASGAVRSGSIGVTGTPDGTKFLRDDYSWQEAGGSIASGTITWDKIGSGAVQSSHVASGQVSWQHLAANSVYGAIGGIGHIVPGSIGSGNIGSGQVGDFGIASGKVLWWHLGSGAVRSGNVASGSLGWVHVGSGAIRSGHISSGSVGTNHISSGSVLNDNHGFSSGHWKTLLDFTYAGSPVSGNTISWSEVCRKIRITYNLRHNAGTVRNCRIQLNGWSGNVYDWSDATSQGAALGNNTSLGLLANSGWPLVGVGTIVCHSGSDVVGIWPYASQHPGVIAYHRINAVVMRGYVYPITSIKFVGDIDTYMLSGSSIFVEGMR